jgi:dihydrofolate reductase
MRKVTFSMGMSLDGYICGPDGTFDWRAPDEELFRFTTDEVRDLGVHLMGRRLYEAMLVWESPMPEGALPFPVDEFAELWRALPKVVFSSTLTEVEGNARLAAGSLAEEIERLRAEPGEGNIGIGGATLATAAGELGLVDEYRTRVYPVVVGGGIPFFPQAEQRVDLDLLATRAFSCGVVHLHHRVRRDDT